MNHSGALYRLIQSMTQSEKRYFNVLVSAHRDSSDYLKLFKAIDEKKGYDDAAVKELLKDEPFIKHLAVKKIHLYQLLLRSLRNFHEGKTFDFSLKEMMIESSILSDKALYKDSYAMIMKAKALAEQFEDWKVLLEIIHKEYILVPHVIKHSQIEKEFQRLAKEDKDVIAQLNNYGEIAYQAIAFQMTTKKYSFSNGKLMKSLKQVMSHPLLKSDKNAISFRAKSLFYIIRSGYHLHLNEFEKAESFLKRHIQMYEQFPHFIEAAPGNYLSALRDLLTVRFRMKRFDAAKLIIKQLEQLPERKIGKFRTSKFKSVLLSFTLHIELAIALQTNSEKEILKKNAEAEDYFLRHAHLMEARSRMKTYLALASSHFEMNDHKKADYFLQKIFRDKDVSRFHEIQIVASLLQLIIYLEDGELDSVKQLSSAIKRMGSQNDSLSVKLMAEFSEKLTRSTAHNKLPHIFSEYNRKFSALKQTPDEQIFFDYFDLQKWLAKKSEKSLVKIH